MNVTSFWYSILDLKLPWPVRDYVEAVCKRAAAFGTVPSGFLIDSDIAYANEPLPCLDVEATTDDGKEHWNFFKTFASRDVAIAFCRELQLSQESIDGIITMGRKIKRKVPLFVLLRQCELSADHSTRMAQTNLSAATPLADADLQIEIHATYQRQNIIPKAPVSQWGFDLEVHGKNAGSKNLNQYFVEISVPAGMLNLGNANDFNELTQRRTDSQRVYSFPMPRKAEKKELLPGKWERLGTISCLFSRHNLDLKDAVLSSPIIIDIYGDNMPSKHRHLLVSELNPYKILQVLPEELSYEQTYRLGIIRVT